MPTPNVQGWQDAGLNQPTNVEMLLRQQLDVLQVIYRETKILTLLLREFTNGLPVYDDPDTMRQDPAFNDYTQSEN